MTPEQKLTADVQKRLKALKAEGLPIWWMKIHGSGMQKKGVPDLLIVVAGLAVFVELKAPGGAATKLQAMRMAEIRASGGIAEVCWSADEVAQIVTAAAKARYTPPPLLS